MSPLLQVRHLKTHFFQRSGVVKAVDGIDFSLESGQTLALVGESGSGKSITALSLLRLVPDPGRVIAGETWFEGTDLQRLDANEMRRIRGNRLAMIFQEPMTSLNPVFTIGTQIGEVLQLHRGFDRTTAESECQSLLQRVGIPAAADRLHDYPHQLSGGMRQRVMIAMALACNPRLLIADEPTTALDVTIQQQIMELLRTLRRELGMALLLISHDLGIVAENADRVAIMYAGLIMEYAPVINIFEEPAHPYTQGLLACLPKLGEGRRRLAAIPGQIPTANGNLPGCPFVDRCAGALAICKERLPALVEKTPGHFVRCWRG